MDLVAKYVTPFVRHAFTLAAGWLAAKGVFSTDEASSFVNESAAVALALVGYLWSVWQKYRTGTVLQEAANAPAGSSAEVVVARSTTSLL